MTGAVRETMTLAGRAERARVARAFTGGVLGPGHPCGNVATLLVELFANSIRHSGSAAPGETATVAVKTANDVIRVEVTDLRGPGAPAASGCARSTTRSAGALDHALSRAAGASR